MSVASVFVPADASKPLLVTTAAELCARAGVPGVLPASRLGVRPLPETVPSGIAALDALTGGFPRGALSELCGPASSGRTSVLLALMAEMTRHQEVCALVDASDSFDPHSAAAAGVDLARLLWVRCMKNCQLKVEDCRLKNKNNDRNRQSAIGNRKSSFGPVEQALKATDLLLQGGGFGLVVVDLADIPPHTARRIPLTSWFRFRRAVEHTPTVLLVLEEEPYAKSCASLVVRLKGQPSAPSTSSGQARRQPSENRQPSVREGPAHARLLGGLGIEAEVLRTVQKKPPRSSAAFESRAAWKIG